MDLIWIICRSIVLLGLLIFLFFVFKAKRKHKAIKHYEELRDKLSVREAEEETGITESEYEGYKGFCIGNLIRGFITLVIGASLIGPICEQVNLAYADTTASNVQTILPIIPYVFVTGIVLMTLGAVLRNFYRGGLI